MSEIKQLLEKKARWQKSRKTLSWPEKIRMAEQVRASAEQLRLMGGKKKTATDKSKDVRG